MVIVEALMVAGPGVVPQIDEIVGSRDGRAAKSVRNEQIVCSNRSDRLDRPFQNRSVSKANLFHNLPVLGLSGAPSTHSRPRRTGKSVGRETNNGSMVHPDRLVADTRRSRFGGHRCVNAGAELALGSSSVGYTYENWTRIYLMYHSDGRRRR